MFFSNSLPYHRLPVSVFSFGCVGMGYEVFSDFFLVSIKAFSSSEHHFLVVQLLLSDYNEEKTAGPHIASWPRCSF